MGSSHSLRLAIQITSRVADSTHGCMASSPATTSSCSEWGSRGKFSNLWTCCGKACVTIYLFGYIGAVLQKNKRLFINLAWRQVAPGHLPNTCQVGRKSRCALGSARTGRCVRPGQTRACFSALFDPMIHWFSLMHAHNQRLHHTLHCTAIAEMDFSLKIPTPSWVLCLSLYQP
jgi:hypothetical protein